jgi:hypothetical protein
MRKELLRSSDRGQLIPLVALNLIVLMGFTALAVDVGYWRYQQRIEQTAADSAAIAGSTEISYPAANNVVRAARHDATSNGFTDGVAGATVAVNWPPQSGPSAGSGNAVEVVITRLQPSFFAGIFGINQAVKARSVAVLSSAGVGCVYVLGVRGTVNITLNGGGQGGIRSNPLCGLVVSGNMTVTGQATVDVSYASYAGTGPNGGLYPHARPVHGAAGGDPCPRVAGCAYLATLKTSNPSLFSAPCKDGGGNLPANPLPPGHYCNGPYWQTVTLQPGLFVMDEGMFQGQTSGTGVTIYNNCSKNAYQYGNHGSYYNNDCDVTLSAGNSSGSIVAPLTGAAAGMVYYQPPELTNVFTANGVAGTVQAIGGVYAPGGTFTFNGQLPTISFLVSGAITMNGSGLNVGAWGGYPLPVNAVLAE